MTATYINKMGELTPTYCVGQPQQYGIGGHRGISSQQQNTCWEGQCDSRLRIERLLQLDTKSTNLLDGLSGNRSVCIATDNAFYSWRGLILLEGVSCVLEAGSKGSNNHVTLDITAVVPNHPGKRRRIVLGNHQLKKIQLFYQWSRSVHNESKPISGNPLHHKEFLQGLQTSSWHHEDLKQNI